MRQQVLKALANPARIFYVPYSIAVMNFAAQFIVFVTIFFTDLLINGTDAKFSPMYFIISVGLAHIILAGVSKKEPQLANIIAAKIRLFKVRAPNRIEV
ncbi:MAG: VirB3 family type IV secretion system protein [Alphaproteobacteria bacterium]|nr:VirB3 family type IV secretion system protein [Alphaproteobacteria bacterium]